MRFRNNWGAYTLMPSIKSNTVVWRSRVIRPLCSPWFKLHVWKGPFRMRNRIFGGTDPALIIAVLKHFKAWCDAWSIYEVVVVWPYNHPLVEAVGSVTKAQVAFSTKTSRAQKRCLTSYLRHRNLFSETVRKKRHHCSIRLLYSEHSTRDHNCYSVHQATVDQDNEVWIGLHGKHFEGLFVKKVHSSTCDTLGQCWLENRDTSLETLAQRSSLSQNYNKKRLEKIQLLIGYHQATAEKEQDQEQRAATTTAPNGEFQTRRVIVKLANTMTGSTLRRLQVFLLHSNVNKWRAGSHRARWTRSWWNLCYIFCAFSTIMSKW